MGKIHETTGTSMILGTYRGALFKKALFFFIGLAISVYFFRMAFNKRPWPLSLSWDCLLAHGLFRHFHF